MIPRGLILATSVGIVAGAILGVIFVDSKNPNELNFQQGPSLSILTEKTDFKKGETITIRIINSGSVPLTFSDVSYGLKISGLDGTLLYSPVAAQVISVLEPKEEKSFEWDQIKNDGDSMLEGTYKISSSAMDNLEKTIKKSITINIYK
ncbi:MAG: hypothetical protein NPMRTHETA2_470004 [Nitrosopumilales archaeon]|nr:MAG: hypothetical protein NPMRTHETA2_470004 [Nitrosopumilales archaeon]